MTRTEFDYQSDRHCAKTTEMLATFFTQFDYQSDRHCAKTSARISKPTNEV